jgi:rfaE bifunctional protein nucleotidyltransferase chain/domain
VTGIVLCHGCWDLLHLGHIQHLRAAKSMGEWLIVSVTADRFVNKGPGRPVFTAEDRAEVLMALRFVDEVIVNDAQNASQMINRVKPDFYVKGCDYKLKRKKRMPDDLVEEIMACLGAGCQFVTTDTPKLSSTAILEAMA